MIVPQFASKQLELPAQLATKNMSEETSNAGCEEASEVRGIKRRNEKEWVRNVAKRRRAEGKSYTSVRGKKIDARKTGDKCRYYYHVALTTYQY